MKIGWLLLLLGWGQFAYAASPDSLDLALIIVYEQSAALNTAQAQAGIARGTSSVNTKLRLSSGYSDKSNDEYSTGYQNRGMFTLEIPITGGGSSKTDKDRAAALGNLYKIKDDLAAKVILEVQKMMMLKRTLDIKRRVHQRITDEIKRLSILNKGLSEHAKTDLMPISDQSLTVQYEVEIAGLQYSTTVLSASRSYGKEKWPELKKHIMDYINLVVPPLPPLYEK